MTPIGERAASTRSEWPGVMRLITSKKDALCSGSGARKSISSLGVRDLLIDTRAPATCDSLLRIPANTSRGLAPSCASNASSASALIASRESLRTCSKVAGEVFLFQASGSASPDSDISCRTALPTMLVGAAIGDLPHLFGLAY